MSVKENKKGGSIKSGWHIEICQSTELLKNTSSTFGTCIFRRKWWVTPGFTAVYSSYIILQLHLWRVSEPWWHMILMFSLKLNL